MTVAWPDREVSHLVRTGAEPKAIGVVFKQTLVLFLYQSNMAFVEFQGNESGDSVAPMVLGVNY